MQTVITKELAVIDNQLRTTRRRVRLVGENLSFEIKIVCFDSEPRILQQCSECRLAKFIHFVPAANCEDSKNMRSTTIECADGQNIWQENHCAQFIPRV
ncbi:MAG: hypothetical protein Q8R34_02120 [bacterium]|nr:hypothetical protein [bacterium]